MFLFHSLLYNLLGEQIKNGGHQTIFRSGEQNLPLSPRILRLTQYKTLWSVLFVIYINLYYWKEVIHYYKAEKEEEKTNNV